jgi:GTP-binding protein LepA
MIFDSVFNSYRGVIAYYRIFNGTIKKGQKIKFFNTGSEYFADEIGVLKLSRNPRRAFCRKCRIHYTGVKESKEIKVGDTITTVENPIKEAVQGLKM